MNQLSVIYTWTKDELRLQGMHYEPEKKDVGVVFIHGMSGNFIENVFADMLGITLSQNGYGFIYGHNRGFSHINDISKKFVKSDNSYESARHGAVYERFQSCVYDIEAWIDEARRLGYRRLVLIGHSLGGPKLIYWWAKNKPTGIMGVILASPADMVGLTVKGLAKNDYEVLVNEAKEYIKKGEYTHILSKMIDDWFLISAQTFLDESVDNCPADVLPVLRNPNLFPELATIEVPILSLYGEFDSAVIKNPKDDLQLLKAKATGCPDFQTIIVDGANHTYENREQEFSEVIVKWIKGLEAKK